MIKIIFFLCTFVSLCSHRINTKPSSNFYENNGNFFWKVGKSNDIRKNTLKKYIFNGFPVCITRKQDEEILAISDICVHRAASLSQGRVLSNGCIRCPYHGWEFQDGMIDSIPGCPEHNKMSNFGVPRFMTKEINSDVYLCPTYDINSEKGNYPVNKIYVPDEASEQTFRRVSGRRHIKRPNNLVTENVLDMMHVSYVHSFGNRLSPVPFEIQYKDIDELSGRTTFYYTAGPTSMSAMLGKAKFVKVENEFYLPDTTVTRVFANDIVKTIVTHCYPIGKNESILHYDLYRNFLDSPFFDSAFRYQMDLTLDEDVDILNQVYDVHMKGFMNSKFDVTPLNFRKKLNNVHKKLNNTKI
jgi:phenylpropionate dioxygenase-like ring-hydroxylating dioxygenase large terminal subunit